MNDTEALYDEITAFISESRALLERGAMMELAGLDDRVRELCERAILSPQAERERYADKLQQLLKELDALSEDMKRQQAAVSDEIRHAVTHRKASVAYLTTSGTGGDKDANDE